MTLINQMPFPNKNSFEDRFNRVKQEKENPESNTEFAIRNVGQNIARAGEIAVGLPGNFKSAVKGARDYLESFLPEQLRVGEGLSGKQEKKPLGEQSIGNILYNPPTSHELREGLTKPIAKTLTGNENYLEPKGDVEKAVGEFNQDLTSMFMPGTGQFNMLTRIGAPLAANLAKEGMKFAGVSDENAEKAKMGIMLGTTLAGQSNPGRFASERIAQGKQMIPQNTTVAAGPLAQLLNPLVARLRRGLQVPSKAQAMRGMEDLAGQIKNGRIGMHSLMDARDNINEWIAEAGGWDVPETVRNPTLRNLNELKRGIIETIDQNMTTRFPEAGELYRTGYEAAAVTHQSNAITNFIQKNFGNKAASIGAKLLFPSLAGGAAVLPKTMAVGAALYPGYKAGQVLYRVSHSPTLANYYSNVIQSSIIGNAPAMIHNMDKLDKALKEDEKKRNKGKEMSLDEFKSSF